MIVEADMRIGCWTREKKKERITRKWNISMWLSNFIHISTNLMHLPVSFFLFRCCYSKRAFCIKKMFCIKKFKAGNLQKIRWRERKRLVICAASSCINSSLIHSKNTAIHRPTEIHPNREMKDSMCKIEHRIEFQWKVAMCIDVQTHFSTQLKRGIALKGIVANNAFAQRASVFKKNHHRNQNKVWHLKESIQLLVTFALVSESYTITIQTTEKFSELHLTFGMKKFELNDKKKTHSHLYDSGMEQWAQK